MKQTAVEWYCNEMESLRVNAEINNMDAYKFIIRRAEIFEQAKAMEKEQIIEAWNIRAKIDGVLTYTDNRTAEQYYNETFKSE
jgi:hypothetical protein